MNKTLICGATGFIGRNLIEHFASIADHEVHSVWHELPSYEIENVTWHRGGYRENMMGDTTPE